MLWKTLITAIRFTNARTVQDAEMAIFMATVVGKIAKNFRYDIFSYAKIARATIAICRTKRSINAKLSVAMDTYAALKRLKD